jgi:hypothetical protein
MALATLCFLGMWFSNILNTTSIQDHHLCTLPSEGFTVADLVGTWIAGTPDQRDTLIIKADGTYKQIIHIEFSELPPKNFESDWQKWWLERGNNGVPVLHLEGYRLCGYNAGISCDILGGSGVHMCQVDYKEIAGEGVLYVMGESEITLSLPLGLEDSYGYWRSP